MFPIPKIVIRIGPAYDRPLWMATLIGENATYPPEVAGRRGGHRHSKRPSGHRAGRSGTTRSASFGLLTTVGRDALDSDGKWELRLVPSGATALAASSIRA